MQTNLTQSLQSFKHCYSIGIKGVGMTALAQCLLDKGITVAGCDVSEEFVTQKILSSLPIQIDNLDVQKLPIDTDFVIYGSAHQGKEHFLAQQAIKRSIPLYSHAQILGMLSQEKDTIAVCGVGGKSTTSALLAWILESSQEDPSYHVGVGEITGLPRTGRWHTTGSLFITEADEYAENPQAVARGEEIIPRFHYLQPKIIICTNLLYDHPDVYASFETTAKTFYSFFTQLKQNGILLWNADDAQLQTVVQKLHDNRPDILTVSFGYSKSAEVQIHELGYETGAHLVEFISNKQSLIKQNSQLIRFSLPGSHNLQNAAATWTCLRLIQLTDQIIAHHMATFQSTSRRFQLMNTIDESFFYDDYAHHPTEIAATLSACKALFPNHKLVVLFQPHTFSRTQALLPDFANAFSKADTLLLIPIFGSARENIGTITLDDLAKAIKTARSVKTDIRIATSITNAVEQLGSIDTKKAVVITLGAGDVYTIHDLLAQKGHA